MASTLLIKKKQKKTPPQQVRTKMEEFPSEEDTVLLLLDRVSEAQRIAAIETREAGLSKEGESNGASGKWV